MILKRRNNFTPTVIKYRCYWDLSCPVVFTVPSLSSQDYWIIYATLTTIKLFFDILKAKLIIFQILVDLIISCNLKKRLNIQNNKRKCTELLIMLIYSRKPVLTDCTHIILIGIINSFYRWLWRWWLFFLLPWSSLK